VILLIVAISWSALSSAIMSIRQLCRQTTKRPLNTLFYFRDKEKTEIAPICVGIKKQLDLVVGMVVTVNWNGKKTEGEILALNGKFFILLFS